MPLQPCTKNGKSGWKWGTKGKCYTGSNAKQLAMKQATAIRGSQKRRGKKPKKI